MPGVVQGHDAQKLLQLTRKMPETWVLIGLITGVGAMAAFKGVQHMYTPDVQASRSRRGASVLDPKKYDERTGLDWHERLRKNYMPAEYVHGEGRYQMFDAFTAKYWQRKWEAKAHPESNTISGMTGSLEHFNKATVGVPAILAGAQPKAQ